MFLLFHKLQTKIVKKEMKIKSSKSRLCWSSQLLSRIHQFKLILFFFSVYFNFSFALATFVAFYTQILLVNSYVYVYS